MGLNINKIASSSDIDCISSWVLEYMGNRKIIAKSKRNKNRRQNKNKRKNKNRKKSRNRNRDRNRSKNKRIRTKINKRKKVKINKKHLIQIYKDNQDRNPKQKEMIIHLNQNPKVKALITSNHKKTSSQNH